MLFWGRDRLSRKELLESSDEVDADVFELLEPITDVVMVAGADLLLRTIYYDDWSKGLRKVELISSPF